jgi:hypothetical protein
MVDAHCAKCGCELNGEAAFIEALGEVWCHPCADNAATTLKGLKMATEKPLEHQFEDDLGKLVDRYLLDGIKIDALKRILQYEASHDHLDRRRELEFHW